MSVQLIQACCCGEDCPAGSYRRAYLCEDDSATDYYALAGDLTDGKIYLIDDDQCVYFAGCYEEIPEGGAEATINQELDDCDDCAGPCSCDALPDSYLFTGTVTDTASGNTCTITSVLTKAEAALWYPGTSVCWAHVSGDFEQNFDGSFVSCDGDISLAAFPVGDGTCYWQLNVTGATYAKFFGATPITPGYVHVSDIGLTWTFTIT